MLIKNEQLDIQEFKDFFPKLTWTRVPRKLGIDHKDYFYIGLYEDAALIVKASVRPSLRMQLFESFKNRTLEGQIPTPEYKGKLCEWGGSVTVQLNTAFFNKIKEVSFELVPAKIQTIEW